MVYTVETIQQALLDQGITELQFHGTTYSVTETRPIALLYIWIHGQLISSEYSSVPDGHDFLFRTVQALQMFGDSYIISLVEKLAAED